MCNLDVSNKYLKAISLYRENLIAPLALIAQSAQPRFTLIGYMGTPHEYTHGLFIWKISCRITIN